jgi:hypothetical protein
MLCEENIAECPTTDETMDFVLFFDNNTVESYIEGVRPENLQNIKSRVF